MTKNVDFEDSVNFNCELSETLLSVDVIVQHYFIIFSSDILDIANEYSKDFFNIKRRTHRTNDLSMMMMMN